MKMKLKPTILYIMFVFSPSNLRPNNVDEEFIFNSPNIKNKLITDKINNRFLVFLTLSEYPRKIGSSKTFFKSLFKIHLYFY